MSRLNRIYSLSGSLLWGMMCGCVHLAMDFLVAHLDFFSKADIVEGLLQRGLLFGLGILISATLLRMIVPSLRQTHEGLECLIGGIAFINCTIIAILRGLSYTTFALGSVICLATLIGINVILIGISLRLARRYRDAEWPAGWSVRWTAVALPMLIGTVYMHEFVYWPLTRFKFVTILTYGGPTVAVIAIALFSFRKPHRNALLIAASVCVLMACTLIGWSQEQLRKRHTQLTGSEGIQKVLFITVDTLRYDMIFNSPGEEELAPNMKKLLEGGINFQNGVSPAPWTLTSFASLMTGLEPLVHGRDQVARKLSENAETLADVFSENDFNTRAVLFNFNLSANFGLNQGFDEYVFADSDDVEKLFNRIVSRLLGTKLRDMIGLDLRGDNTKDISRIGIDWIHELKDERFFVWMHFLDPHVPYSPPRRYADDPSIDEFGREFEYQRDKEKPPDYFTPERRKWVRKLYEGEVRYVDTKIAEIVAALQETEQYDDTLIVFTSDHGEEFWEHGGFEHGHTLHQELLHVPMAMKLPGKGRSLIVKDRVSTAQLAPTILELSGFGSRISGMDYPSLAGVIDENSTTTGTMHGIWAGGILYGEPQRAWIEDNLKLIVHSDDRIELFDMASDPAEQENLAASHPDDASAMKQRLLDHELKAAARRDAVGLASDTEEEILSPEHLEGLKDLGYM